MDLATRQQFEQLFISTIDPNPQTQKQAEQYILQYSQNEQSSNQFLLQVFQFIMSDSATPTTPTTPQQNSNFLAAKQAAAIFLKNFIKSEWRRERPTTTVNDDDEDEFSKLEFEEDAKKPKLISQETKNIIKQHIVDAVIHSIPVIRTQLVLVVSHIIDCDYPEHWPNLLNHLMQLLASNDLNKIMGSLLCLEKLYWNFRYSSEKYTKTMQQICNQTMEVLTNLFQYLNSNQQYKNFENKNFAEMRKVLLRIFWYSVNFANPKYFEDHKDKYKIWMDYMLEILSCPYPQEVSLDSIFWKSKKWIGYVMLRLVNSHTSTIKKPFSKYFVETYAVPFLQVFIQIIDAKNKQRTPVLDKLVVNAFSYINSCLSTSKLYNHVLKPKLNYLISEITMPMFGFSSEDKDLWDSEPNEYLQKNFDPELDASNPRFAAANLLTEISKKGDDALMLILQYLQTNLNSYLQNSSKNYSMKMACLYAVGFLNGSLRKHKTIKENLEQLMITHVLPEISSQFPPLKAMACWVLGRYTTIKWTNPANFENGLKAVINCIQDKELIVRVQASIALNPLLNNPKATQVIKPILTPLLESFLKLMNEIDQGDLIESLEIIIDSFEQDVVPFAVGLVNNLVTSFIRVFDSSSTEEDDDSMEQSGLIAARYLQVVTTILRAVSKNENKVLILNQLLPQLSAVMKKCFSEDGYEFTDLGCEIMTNLTYFLKPIPKECWDLLPVMLDAVQNWGFDYVTEMVPSLDNFISFGSDVLLSNTVIVNHLLNLIQTTLKDSAIMEQSCTAAAVLSSSLLQNCKGKIDSIAPGLVELAIHRLPTVKHLSLKILLLDVIADGIIYNPVMALQVLESKNMTPTLFSLWFNTLPSYKRIYDKKVSVIALATLLQLNPTSLPQVIQLNLSQVVTSCLTMLKEIQQLKEQYEQEKQQREEEEKEYEAKWEAGEGLVALDDEEEDDDEALEVDDDDDGDDEDDLSKPDALKSLIDQIQDSKDLYEEDVDELEEEEIESPVMLIDEQAYFAHSFKKLADTHQQIMQQIVSKLNPQDVTALQQICK